MFLGAVDPLTNWFYRSVHNTRIERLWFDFTQGVGGKWKDFFIDLENHHGLDPDNPAHIWLLQYLFLAAINEDVADWAKTWNAHKIQLRGERDRSPLDMFIFGMVEDGPRGIAGLMQVDEEDDEDLDLAQYGVDWEGQDDPVLMAHFQANNPEDALPRGAFAPVTAPERLSGVAFDSPNSPLTDHQEETLAAMLGEAIDMSSRSMTIRRVIWQIGFDFCRDLA
jgi:hypothetical protein